MTLQTPPFDSEQVKTYEPTVDEAVKIVQAQHIITNTSCAGVVQVVTPAYPTYEAKQRMLALAKGVT